MQTAGVQCREASVEVKRKGKSPPPQVPSPPPSRAGLVQVGRAYVLVASFVVGAVVLATRALFIGLGAGSAVRDFYLRHRIRTDVVEIDPSVPDIARRYFDFPADVPVIVEDGRQYVERAANRYDFVALDAFNSETHPVHLFTREFFASVERLLNPDGVFVVNMMVMPYGEPAAWRAV